MCNCKIRTSTLTSCQFRARKVISEKNNPAKQAHKIWRKNFKGLLSYHILGVGSLFLAAPCIVQFHEGVCKNWACRERRSAVYLCFDGEGFVHWCTLDDPKEKMKRRIWTKLPFEFFMRYFLYWCLTLWYITMRKYWRALKNFQASSQQWIQQKINEWKN